MKKISLFTIALFLCSMFIYTQSYADSPMRIGGELGVQLPMGDFSDGAGTGFGISGIFQYETSPGVILGGTIGYQSFGGKTSGVSFSNIPIMALFNYKFAGSSITPFVGAEAGLNMFSSSYEIYGFKGSSSSTEFGLNLLAGIESRMNPNLSWRINAKYNIIFTSGSNASYLGLNAGLMYHLQ